MSDLHEAYRRMISGHYSEDDLTAWLDKRDAEMRRRLMEIAEYGQELSASDRRFLKNIRVQA